MARILAVDDEEKILQIIQRALEKDGHIVQTVKDAAKVGQMELSRFDLILLDVMMPGIDGFTLCREIRKIVDCPIVFLTAKTLEEDLMMGLGVGADDYIRKPFGLGELRARVQAHLRREQREKRQVFSVSGLHFYMQAKKVMAGEAEVLLTKSEYQICEYLALHHGQTLSREQIYTAVFGYEGESDASAITEHIKNIRAKFMKVQKEPIETVWGMGYRWN
nr:response regulator transcription factor [uncultured Faecalimonas sp.]